MVRSVGRSFPGDQHDCRVHGDWQARQNLPPTAQQDTTLCSISRPAPAETGSGRDAMLTRAPDSAGDRGDGAAPTAAERGDCPRGPLRPMGPLEASRRPRGYICTVPNRAVVALSVTLLAACQPAPPLPPDLPSLTAESASNFAQITLRCVAKAYPSQPGYVLNAPDDVQLPEVVHPAFYGCYDWHSSVHGHWMLARLLRLFPTLPEAPEISRRSTGTSPRRTSRSRPATSTQAGHRRPFERTYGWAWLLKLAEELHGWDDAGREALGAAPAAAGGRDRQRATSSSCRSRRIRSARACIRTRRSGSAFALDYARGGRQCTRWKTLVERAKPRLLRRRRRRTRPSWEPGGADFLSPSAGRGRPDAPRAAAAEISRVVRTRSCRRCARASRRRC